MDESGRAVDFITIDGGEGGTGAGPLAFTDHVSLPFRVGFARVYRAMAEYDLHQKIVFVGSGRLGLPADALLAFGMGCDMIAVAREAMLAIGCIQAQRCQSGHCPTGVATQNRWFAHGLDAELQAEHFANYVRAFRKELLRLELCLWRTLIPAWFKLTSSRFWTATSAAVRWPTSSTICRVMACPLSSNANEFGIDTALVAPNPLSACLRSRQLRSRQPARLPSLIMSREPRCMKRESASAFVTLHGLRFMAHIVKEMRYAASTGHYRRYAHPLR